MLTEKHIIELVMAVRGFIARADFGPRVFSAEPTLYLEFPYMAEMYHAERMFRQAMSTIHMVSGDLQVEHPDDEAVTLKIYGMTIKLRCTERMKSPFGVIPHRTIIDDLAYNNVHLRIAEHSDTGEIDAKVTIHERRAPRPKNRRDFQRR